MIPPLDKRIRFDDENDLVIFGCEILSTLDRVYIGGITAWDDLSHKPTDRYDEGPFRARAKVTGYIIPRNYPGPRKVMRIRPLNNLKGE